MKYDEVVFLIEKVLNRVLTQKGLPPATVNNSTRLLDGELSIDSLDLAVMVTELEQETKKDPFKDGFKSFTTVDQLAQLYLD